MADTLSRNRPPAESVSTTYARLHDNEDEPNESIDFVKSKVQLEAELAELENIVVHYHLKKAEITQFMATDAQGSNSGLPTIKEDNKDGTVRMRFRRGASASSKEGDNGEARPHDPRR